MYALTRCNPFQCHASGCIYSFHHKVGYLQDEVTGPLERKSVRVLHKVLSKQRPYDNVGRIVILMPWPDPTLSPSNVMATRVASLFIPETAKRLTKSVTRRQLATSLHVIVAST